METMYPGIPFSPQAVLTATVGAADTIIKVSNISAFPPAPNYATIGTDEDGETILYTAKTADSLSGCQRGVEGTAKAWNAGELIGRNFTAADHNAMIENLKKLNDEKQDALKGVENQIVSFDQDGKPEAKPAPFLPLAGGTMTGPITLSGDPTADNHAVNKAYVDGQIGDIAAVLDSINGEVA